MPYYKTDSIVKYCKKCDEFCVGLIVMHRVHQGLHLHNSDSGYVETCLQIFAQFLALFFL